MPDVAGKIRETLAAKARVYPCHVNRASEAGHPCLRYLVYCRTCWQEKSAPDATLQGIFELGNVLERWVVRLIEEAGFTFQESQRPFEDANFQLTGHIDGMIVVDGKRYPTEIKTCNPHDWQKIRSVEDMHRSKKVWWRKYPAQMQLYLGMSGEEEGMFLLVNKTSGEIKQVNVTFDAAYYEQIMQRVEAVNRHIAEETVPERIPYDEDVCGHCAFAHICLPDKDYGEGATIVTDDEVQEMLDRWMELRPLAKEFQDLDAVIKAKFRGCGLAICGPYLVESKAYRTTRWNIPRDVKESHPEWRVETECYRTSIRLLSPGGSDA
jgi:CRISPR/Cas system-associated exonuclease Cas4 (RecB family)